MTDLEITAKLKSLAMAERQGQVEFLRYLSEMDERKLFLALGYSSLFSYCTRELGMSEGTTSKRIQVARAGRKFPLVLERLACNAVNLTNASVLAPHLTAENHRSLLEQAARKSKYDVEKLVAAIAPKAEVKDVIRKLSELTFSSERENLQTPVASTPRPPNSKPESLTPHSAARTRISFTADEDFVVLYRKLQSLLRHKYPHGKFEDIAAEAFSALLEKVDPTRKPDRAHTPRPPKKHTRYIPAHVKREVWRRDGSQCTFVSKTGRRCSATGFLQLDHIIPWSLGGSSWDVDNLTLRCGAHNRWRAGDECSVRLARKAMVDRGLDEYSQ